MGFQNSFNNLAQQVETGSARAKAQFARQMEPQLVRIVRRVLEKGAGSSSLERKILATAQRLRPSHLGGAPDAAPVAQTLCDMVVSRLWPGATESGYQGTMIV